jgi:hypothetical protein
VSAPKTTAAAAAMPGMHPYERKRYQDRTTAALRELAHELTDEMQEAEIRSVMANQRDEAQLHDAVHATQWVCNELAHVLAAYVVYDFDPITSIAEDSRTSPYNKELHREVAERLAVKLKKSKSHVATVWEKHGKPFVRGDA